MNDTFEAIAGYETEKAELRRLCALFRDRKALLEKGAALPKGIVFYGETGTGKTLFARVLAAECGMTVRTIDLGGVGGGNEICKRIRKVFERAARSREPSMIFFDEFDKVLPNAYEDVHSDREKTVLAQLLTLIDGLNSSPDTIFVGTCNDYSTLPATLVRPGRIDKKIRLGLPSPESRTAILAHYLAKTPCRFALDAETIAKRCHGFSCAALETLVNECILGSERDGTVGEDLIDARIREILTEDIPHEEPTIDPARAAANVGTWLVAQKLAGGEAELNADDDTVCNAFFDELLSAFDNDYDDDCYDDDDYDDFDEDYDDEDDDEDMYDDFDDFDDGDTLDRAVQHNGGYSKDNYLDAIAVLMARFSAQRILLDGPLDTLGYSLTLVERILYRMMWSGLYGWKYRFEEDRELPYSPAQIGARNELYDRIVAECADRADKILEEQTDAMFALYQHLLGAGRIDGALCNRIVAANEPVRAAPEDAD